jgi:PAS domain S-box-containing protein
MCDIGEVITFLFTRLRNFSLARILRRWLTVKKDKNSRHGLFRTDIFDEDGLRKESVDFGVDSLPIEDSYGKASDSEEKFRLVFQQNPLGVFHFDVNGTVTDCNNRMIEIWGSSREKFIGFDLLSSLKNKKMKAAVKTCLSGREACYEGQYLSVTGGRISNLKANYAPILSKDGTVIGGMAVIADLSEAKESEDALRESGNVFRLLYSQLLAAQETERTLIARNLNDGIASSLSGIKVSLESALELARTSGFDPEMLGPVITKMQHIMEESRRITTELRPAMLDELGVISTVGWFIQRYQEDNPGVWVKTELAIEEDEIPDHLRTVIFRVVQDFFRGMDVGRKGRMVGVALGKSQEGIYLEIEDSGPGCGSVVSPNMGSGEGSGFLGIRERVELAGGRMKVELKEGVGCVLRADWPFPNEQSAEDRWYEVS